MLWGARTRHLQRVELHLRLGGQSCSASEVEPVGVLFVLAAFAAALLLKSTKNAVPLSLSSLSYLARSSVMPVRNLVSFVSTFARRACKHSTHHLHATHGRQVHYRQVLLASSVPWTQ